MKIKIIIVLLFICFNINAQKIIEGTVYSIITNKPQSFITIRVVVNDSLMVSGTTTNKHGKFKIEIPNNINQIQLILSYFGYENTVIPLSILNIKKIKADFTIGANINKTDFVLSKEEAENDIKNGIIQIYLYAKPIYNLDTLNAIASDFGFKYNPLNLPVNQNVIQSVEIYNTVVYRHLNKINGFFWKKKFKKKIKMRCK